MSAGRFALVIALGVATYLATQDAPTGAAPASLPSPRAPITIYAPLAQVKPHPVPELTVVPELKVDSAQSTGSDRPPLPTPGPRPASAESVAALAAQLEQVSHRLGELTIEIDKLKEFRAYTETQQSSHRGMRTARALSSEARIEALSGAAPVSLPKPRRSTPPPAVPESGDILGLAKVTERLMERIERLEK